MPNDDLYTALKPLSRNLGAGDYEAQVRSDGGVLPVRQPDAAFDLLRIGDAVDSRNIHAAIHDGVRYAMRL